MTAPDLVDGHLALVRRALEPSDLVRKRVEARLAAQPHAATPLLELSGVGEHRTLSASAAMAGGAVLVVLSFAAGYFLRGAEFTSGNRAAPLPAIRETAPSAFPKELPERVPNLPALETAPVRDSAEPARPHELPSAPRRQVTSRAVQRGTTAESTPKVAPSQDEMLLLQRAERAVRGESTALALMLVAELDAQHPRSEWMEERRAIELMAHCVGHATDSRPRAERFLAAHPRSVYTDRVTLLCQLEPSSTEPF